MTGIMTAEPTSIPDTDPDAFFVTDAMYVEVQAMVSRKFSMAKQAVIYPSGAATGGWDFELAYDEPEARRLAREIGPDAVVLDL